MPESDELDVARTRLPVGEHVTGRVIRFPVDSVAIATVTDVFQYNRECIVRFEDCWSVLEWTGDAPRVGTAGRYTVTRHLDHTRRILLTPTDSAAG
jgi:hypothetical protein